VDGVEAVLTRFSARGWGDPRWLAYMLATAHHETGGTMQAVRETFAPTMRRPSTGWNGPGAAESCRRLRRPIGGGIRRGGAITAVGWCRSPIARITRR
jgi:hypothetical protein